MAAALKSVNAPSTTDPRARKLRESEIQKLLDAGKTQRARELEYLQSVFEGTQYVGRPSFFSDDVPMQEREPCCQYRLAAIGIESNAAFAMGEGRFPSVLSLSSEDDSAFDDDLGLSPKDSKAVDSFNAKLLDLANLQTVFTNAYKMAQAARSVAIVLGFRAGLPFADLVWSKLCTPTFGDPDDPTRCTRLEIRYRYTELWRDQIRTGGEWWKRVFEYLRVIDDTADTEYWPVAIWEETDPGVVEGSSPVRAQTKHGFKLCPVHWYARNRETNVASTPDGHALHDGPAICGMLEQIDLGISQRHRAAVYVGDPQTVVSGVSAEDPIGNVGRKVQPVPDPRDVDANGRLKGPWAAAMYGGPKGGGGTGALRRGAGEVWRIQDPSGKATLLTLPADALDGLDKDVQDLVQKVCDDIGICIIDLALFKGAGDLSGRTLSFLFSKQINRVSQDRKDLGRNCILPVLNLFYRMLLASPDGVYLPGLKKLLPILKRFYKPVAGQEKPIWFAPQLKLSWGDFFEPSDTDEQTRVNTALGALGKLITIETALEHVKGVFAIGSVDQYAKQLQKQKDDQQQRDIDNAAALANATAPALPDDEEDDDKPKTKGAPPGTSAAPDKG